MVFKSDENCQCQTKYNYVVKLHPVRCNNISLPDFLHTNETKQEGHDGSVSLHWLICKIPSYQTFKVALQILGRKFYKITKKSSLYSQSILIFIHRTPVDERHPITRQTSTNFAAKLQQKGEEHDEKIIVLLPFVSRNIWRFFFAFL